MGQIVRITPEEELQAIHKETFINNVPSVTKVSDNSVLSGIIAGNAKTGRKALKDIALAVSQIFPDTATGISLDQVAANIGVAARLGASQSSTFIRIIADNGTVYTQGVHTFTGNHGIVFDLDDASVTVGTKGYAYAKVRSQNTGLITNVNPYTITSSTPEPIGHIGIINEYAADYGRDAESDALLRKRIKEGPNVLAQKTLAYLEQAFITINSDILRVIYEGVGTDGKVILAIATQNGIDLTSNELSTLLADGSKYFAITELSPIGTEAFGVDIKNIEYQGVDVDFRVELYDVGQLDQTVKDIQQKFGKLVDFRFWDSSVDKVEWEDLLLAVKTHPNVKYVPDIQFNPSADVIIDKNKLPRFRGFVLRDLTGSILTNQAGTIDPVFYPNAEEVSLGVTVL